MDINEILANGLTVNEALDLLGPVSVYVLGMAIYALFVFRFYRFVATRDMFALDMSRYEQVKHRWVRSVLHVVLYVVKYIILFPVFAFFWFAVLTAILAFLSKDRTFPETLLMALAIVSAIRITSYFDEDLSKDLAKILPFAILAVFLIDASFFTFSESLEALKEARDYVRDILYYLLFLVALEFVLRLLRGGLVSMRVLDERAQRRQQALEDSGEQREQSSEEAR